MLKWIAAGALSLMFALGAFYTVAPMPAMMLATLVSVCAGLAHARLVRHELRSDTHYPRDGELTLDELIRGAQEQGISECLTLYTDLPYGPIVGWFTAKIGGRTVLILERSKE